jgi:cell division protein FtsI (penicillin-binding protein 3)
MTYLPPYPEQVPSPAHTDVSSWLRKARGILRKAPSDLGDEHGDGAAIHLDGQGKALFDATRTRLIMFAVGLALVYGVIGVRLVDLAFDTPSAGVRAPTPQEQIAAYRPDIVDRNGVLMATDVPATAVYADPSVLVDVDDAVDRLSVVMPDLAAR